MTIPDTDKSSSKHHPATNQSEGGDDRPTTPSNEEYQEEEFVFPRIFRIAGGFLGTFLAVMVLSNIDGPLLDAVVLLGMPVLSGLLGWKGSDGNIPISIVGGDCGVIAGIACQGIADWLAIGGLAIGLGILTSSHFARIFMWVD